jgi:hypothetical protein
MRNIIILLSLFIVACSTNKKLVEDVHEKEQLDSLIVKQKKTFIEISTKSYEDGRELFRLQKNDWYKIEQLGQSELTPESKTKIEKDGGWLKILEKILTKENYAQLDDHLVFLTVGVVMAEEGRNVGTSVSLTANIEKMNLSEKEMRDLLKYASELRFIYRGKELGKVYDSAGLNFTLKK